MKLFPRQKLLLKINFLELTLGEENESSSQKTTLLARKYAFRCQMCMPFSLFGNEI